MLGPLLRYGVRFFFFLFSKKDNYVKIVSLSKGYMCSVPSFFKISRRSTVRETNSFRKEKVVGRKFQDVEFFVVVPDVESCVSFLFYHPISKILS